VYQNVVVASDLYRTQVPNSRTGIKLLLVLWNRLEKFVKLPDLTM